MKIDLLVADDHPTVVAGILHELARVPFINIVGTANNSTQIIERLNSTHCDILLTDYAMPGGEFGDGLMLLAFLARRFLGLKIVVLTMMDNQAMVQQMRKIGIPAIVSKRDESRHLITAINEVYAGAEYFSPSVVNVEELANTGRPLRSAAEDAAGDVRLTGKELEFLRLYSSGHSVGKIAEILHRSKQTISGQKVSVKRKLGISRDADLFRYAFDAGLAMGREDRHHTSAPHEDGDNNSGLPSGGADK
ncbi:response regulator [Paraburkholderia sp. J11-2]|uniref:response regulator n=1 Tax=Paraburkholderia sp. J11-2 TaxID=2805431 RepID=UPI002AB70FE1|nr:response regulator [Paraburkholderia sp. J11-2]